MFDALKETIIGPDPYPWPKWPKRDWDIKDALIVALLYIMFLILTKGVVTGTAFAMAIPFQRWIKKSAWWSLEKILM